MTVTNEHHDNRQILRLILDACFEIHKNDAFNGCERLANILFRHGNHSVLRPPSRSENDYRRTCTTTLLSHGMPKGEGDLVVVHQVAYLLHKYRWDGAMIGKVQRLISEHFDRTGVSEARAFDNEPDEPTAFTADPVELPTHSERVIQDNLNKEAWEKARTLDAIATKLRDAELSVDHLFEIIDTLDEMGYSVLHEKPASIRKFMDAHWSASAQVGHLLEFIDDEGLSGDLRDSLEKILAVGKIVEANGNKENA